MGRDRRPPGPHPGAVEETLRYDPSVPVWRRVTTRPVTLGRRGPARGRQALPVAGRRRAETRTVFDRPGDFDLGRPDAGQHLAFGKGLHYCLGANLGKLEAQIAVAELARRFPDLRLMPGQRLTFHPNISFRGPQVLQVRTHP